MDNKNLPRYIFNSGGSCGGLTGVWGGIEPPTKEVLVRLFQASGFAILTLSFRTGLTSALTYSPKKKGLLLI